MTQGPLDPKALYVVQDPELWLRLSQSPPPGAFIGVVDGFNVLAPLGCAACSADGAGAIARSKEPVPLTLLTGWSGREAWGTWSDGPVAFASAVLPPGPPAPVEVEIEAWAFLSLEHPRQRVHIQANGQSLAQLDYEWGTDLRHRRLRIPASVVAAGQGQLLLRFQFPDAVSPAALGQSQDGRQLALGMLSLRMRPVEGR